MDDDLKNLAPHLSRKPNYTMLSGLLMLFIVAALLSTAFYYIYEIKSWGFMAGIICGVVAWQINYRNCYGKWFDYL
jgi:hypothetical protein